VRLHGGTPLGQKTTVEVFRNQKRQTVEVPGPAE